MNPDDEWLGRYVRGLEPGQVLTERDVAILRYLLAVYQLRCPDTRRELNKHLFSWWRDELKKLNPDKTVDWMVGLIAERIDVSPTQIYRLMSGRER